ncbi:hypothetical protein [Roseivivax isoporae]|nr:hypothetical protein [Roseivivax isoporae]
MRTATDARVHAQSDGGTGTRAGSGGNGPSAPYARIALTDPCGPDPAPRLDPEAVRATARTALEQVAALRRAAREAAARDGA